MAHAWGRFNFNKAVFVRLIHLKLQKSGSVLKFAVASSTKGRPFRAEWCFCYNQRFASHCSSFLRFLQQRPCSWTLFWRRTSFFFLHFLTPFWCSSVGLVRFKHPLNTFFFFLPKLQGLGITVFGMAYMFVHDGLVHRRFPVGPISDVPYLRRVAAAHQVI